MIWRIIRSVLKNVIVEIKYKDIRVLQLQVYYKGKLILDRAIVVAPN